MTRVSRPTKITILLCILLLMLPVIVVQADEEDVRVVEPRMLGSTQITNSPAASPLLAANPPEQTDLLVQATSWVSTSHYYVLTLTNLSPWIMDSLFVLDRYVPLDPEMPETVNAWYPETILPGDAAAILLEIDSEPLNGACHQIEISFVDGIGTILMDCSRAGSTSVWRLTLDAELDQHLSREAITEAAPVGPSKLGIHVTRNNSPEIMAYVKSARPAVVAAVGDLGWLSEIKQVSPDTITLGRFEELDQSFSGDPVEAARAFVNTFAPAYTYNEGVDYWLGWNEPVVDEIWQMEWYAAFEAERVIAMDEMGFKAAIGNFSAGTPEADEFEAFMPAIRVANEHGAILAVHEYSAPTMRDGMGAGIPGLEDHVDRGALTLRYRFWYDHYLVPEGLAIPLVVSEAGIDGGVLKLEGESLFGWRDFAGRRVPESISRQTAESYLDELSWYDDQLRRDPYVLGFAVFNVGDQEGKWASFDMTDLLPQLADRVAGKQ